MAMIKIPIEEANAAQLRYYAETVLGLDGVKPGQSAGHLIGKIQAASPDITQVEVPETMIEAPEAIQPGKPAAPASASPAPSGREGGHFRYDPKVTLQVQSTNDGSRPKRVFVACNGDVIEIKRGVDVTIPYRFFLALENAVELRPRESDEINPNTGMPVIEMVEQPSYPYSVKAMPSAEEIAAWHARTKDMAL